MGRRFTTFVRVPTLIQSENVVTKHVEQAVLARFMPFRGGYVAVMRKESTRIGNGRDLCQRQAPCELLVPGVGTRTESPPAPRSPWQTGQKVETERALRARTSNEPYLS